MAEAQSFPSKSDQGHQGQGPRAHRLTGSISRLTWWSWWRFRLDKAKPRYSLPLGFSLSSSSPIYLFLSLNYIGPRLHQICSLSSVVVAWTWVLVWVLTMGALAMWWIWLFGVFRFNFWLIWFSDLDGGFVMVLVDSVNTGTASHSTTPEQRYTTFCGTVYGIGIYYTASCGMVSKYPKNRTVYTSTQDGFFYTTLCLRGGDRKSVV